MKQCIWMVVVIGIITSCGSSDNNESETTGIGISFQDMDTTKNPADDFYAYANGGWMTHTEIPATEGRWGSFNELRDNTIRAVYNVLKDATVNQKYPEGSDHRKAIDFFTIGIDSMQAEKTGSKPLEKFYNQIQSIKTKEDIQKYLVDQAGIQTGAFFRILVDSDKKKSDVIAVYITSGGLGLPERDFYLRKDDKSVEIRKRYQEHVARMLVLNGLDKTVAEKQAKFVMDIETKLASATMTKEDRRDADKTYNKRSLTQLSDMVSSISWADYFAALGAQGLDSVVVTEPLFLAELDKTMKRSGMEAIQAYLRWHLIRSAAPYLSHAFVKEDFSFYTQYLLGINEMKPRWKRVLESLDRALGEAVGQLYVEKNFPPEAKKKASLMVENIRLAFAERIKNLDWMSDSTKEKALKKLSLFNVKIGYPDEWRDYAGMVVDHDMQKASYIQNVWNGTSFNLKRQVAKLGKPVNKKEWQMSPQTVNAYYKSSFNEIVFPAAILQPPFYNYKADEAVNYGGIGAVIGHEISHGFDDQGSKFDGYGNMRTWWTEEDLKKFNEKGKALADQFSKYEPLPGVFVQGKFTLGENIGDLGGIAVAYDGLQRHLRENGNPGLISGFTPEQRFFISWATVWRTKFRDETLRTQVMTDPHSPGMYRAIGPVSNMTEFYDAFGVNETNKMFRPKPDRVKIW